MKGRIVLKGPFGFVGSAFRRYLEESGIPFEVLTHENREELSTKGVELFIDAAGNSRKFLAERDPVWDRSKNVTEVADSITSFRPRCYLLVSSSAVYADTSRVSATREVADPTGRVSTYGGHKREAERLVRESGARFLILRPAGFFGPGLAKGPLYDLLERRPPRVSPRSRMQLVDVNAFARTALRLAPDGGVINAVSARPTILMEAFPEASAYQQTHFRTDTLPVLDFGLFSDRFSRVAGPQVGGSERLEGFAQNYLQKECREAVEIMVLAGGRGSRLQLEIPKPVAPLAGRPLLRHVLDPIIDAGYSCCTLLLGSESEWVTNVITRDPVLRHARRIVEEKPLGTGGAVIHALLTSRAETVIVVNGDTIYDNFDPELLVKRHRRTGGIVTLLATRMPESGDYGGLVVGIDGRLATFAEKGGKGPCLVYAGCLVLDRRRFLEHFPSDAPCSLERDLLPALETSGQIHVYAHPDTTFVDAGTPERWHQAEAFVRQQSKHSA